MWAQSNLLLYSVQRDAMLQRCPGPDTIWLLPLGPLLLTLYSDGKKKESSEERLISAQRRLNSLSLALVARFFFLKKSSTDIVEKLFQGSSLALFSEEDFTVTWLKCCFTHCSTLPRTHSWKRSWQKSPPVSHHLPFGGKKVISSPHGTFKERNKVGDVSPILPQNHLGFIDVFTDYFLPDCVNDQTTEAPLSQVILHSHLTCSHLRDLLSFLSSSPYFFFQELLLGFNSLSYWSQSAHVRLASGWRESRDLDNSHF